MKNLRATMSYVGPMERRETARWRIELVTSASSPDHSGEVTVCNLSSTGLMLQSFAPLEIGETISIELPDEDPVEACVIWNEGTSYGCEFIEPISSAAIAAALLQAPLTSPRFVAHKPEFEDLPIGRNPSVADLDRWKREFEREHGSEGYAIVAYKQGPGGMLIAVVGKTG